jgi:chromate transporter
METKTKGSVTRRDLFLIFLKAGFAFGGGLGILAVLEQELVTKREAVNRDDFLATYAIGRLIPSGTMTAVAIAYGYQFGGLPGTVLTLTALILPSLTITVLLTMAYSYLENSPFLALLPVTLIPAALAFILLSALKVGKEVFRPSRDLVIAIAGLLGVTVFGVSPAFILILGGVIGTVVFCWQGEARRDPTGICLSHVYRQRPGVRKQPGHAAVAQEAVGR